MARRRTIVGVGETLLDQDADRDIPAGLAPSVALSAALLGHNGVIVSRVGQDDPARRLREQLTAAGVNVSHLQSDPDLPTGRCLGEATGDPGRIEAQAAFDNLQWDFDLTDLAQQANAVVFGGLARRSGQTRSTADRFLAECTMAMRVFDLTNRPDGGLDRGITLAALRDVDAVVIDEDALRSLMPGHGGANREAIRDLMGANGLAFALVVNPALVVHTPQGQHSGGETRPRDQYAAVVGLLHSILAGQEFDDAIRFAEAFAVHRCEHPNDPVPQAVLKLGTQA